jgi:iron-sulfur cluster repair protein YtfE (RIC family)
MGAFGRQMIEAPAGKSHMTTTETESAPPLCAPEWDARSLTELVAHLSERYRASTHERLAAIRRRLQEPRWWLEDPCEAAYGYLVDVFARLCEQVERHMSAEDNMLLPLVIAIEHPQVLSIRQSRDEVTRLVARVADEHRYIRYLLDELKSATRLLVSVSPSPSEKNIGLVSEVATFSMLLREQLDLEDRCLWPRALELFRQLP